MSARRTWLLALSPALAAVACRVLAPLCPVDEAWGNAVQAGLLSAPMWLLVIGLPWAAIVALRRRMPALVLVGLLPLPLAGVPRLSAPPVGLRLVAANVNSFPDRDDRKALQEALSALAPDVLVTMEQRGREVPGLVRVADNFAVPVRRISHHSAVYCRPGLACAAEITPEVGSPTMAMPIALVEVEGLCIVGLHGPPPAPFDPSGLLPYMAEVASRVSDGHVVEAWGPCAAGDPALLIGDFNTVPGSPAFRTLTRAGFDDPERWRGIWGASWPAGGGWPDFPFFRVDNVLARGVDVAVVDRVRLPGSDHKAQVVVVRPD